MYDKLFELLKYTKSKKGMLTVYLLYHNGVFRESDLVALVGADIHTLKGIANELLERNVILTAVDCTGAIYYMLNAKHYDTSDCVDCPNYKKGKLKVKDKKFKIHKCKNKQCQTNFMLDNINKIKGAIALTEKVEVSKVTKNKGDRPIEEWKAKDFAKYIRKTYRKKFPGTKLPVSQNHLNQACGEICALMKGFIGSNKYVLYCKRHIDYIFKKIKTDSDFTIKKFTSFDTIQRTVDIASNNRKRITEGGYCNRYNIECSYFKDGECTIISNSMECTEAIRKYMKEKYG